MKKIILFLICLITTNCVAMSEEEQKKEIVKTITMLNNSEKPLYFLLFYKLYSYIKKPEVLNTDKSMYKTMLKQFGLIENNQLKPMVSQVFTDYLKENRQTILLLDHEIE